MQQDLDITVFNFEFNFPGKFLGCILHTVYAFVFLVVVVFFFFLNFIYIYYAVKYIHAHRYKEIIMTRFGL